MATDGRLRAAVDASVRWYEMVFAVHGLGHRAADGVWAALDPPPPLHSAAKTLEPWATSDAAVRAVDGFGRCSIADSFGALAPAGFDVLFAARWLFREPLEGPATPPPGWSVVRDTRTLARWTAHHGSSDVLLPGLLGRADVTVLATGDGREPTGGCVVQRVPLPDGTVVAGLSNVWAAPDRTPDWGDVVRAVHATLPGVPVVDHEHGEDLTVALAAGFVDVGPQVVWSR